MNIFDGYMKKGSIMFPLKKLALDLIKEENQAKQESEYRVNQKENSFLINDFQAAVLLSRANDAASTCMLQYEPGRGFTIISMPSIIKSWHEESKARHREIFQTIANEVIGDDYTDLEAVDGKEKRPFNIRQCRIGAP